jgi:uncharacterized protein YdeI (YjbR/CyaY-like superfamily)
MPVTGARSAAAKRARAGNALPENAVLPVTRARWRRWLQTHHTDDSGVWYVYYKKGSGKARMSYEDMIEEALSFGWIDGVARALDDERAMIWLSPRKRKSVWSLPNKQRVERILARGIVHPAGLAKIEAAKRDGSWSAMDAVDRLEVPADLALALAAQPVAAANFDAYPKSYKRGALEWIRQAKRPKTRAARIAEMTRRAAANSRFTMADPPRTAAKRTRKSGSIRKGV